MPVTAPPSPTEIDDMLGGYFMPSRCPACPASGYGPLCDHYEDPEELHWPGGSASVRCRYLCTECGCAWTERWRPVWLFGLETM